MIFSREPGTSPTIPGSHLASDLSWQKIWSGTFRKKKCHGFKKEIECIDNVYVLICIYIPGTQMTQMTLLLFLKKTVGWQIEGEEKLQLRPTSGWPSPHTRGPCSWPSGISQARLHLHHPWEIPPGRKTPQPATSICCASNGPSGDPSCTVAHPDPGPKNTEVFGYPPALRQLLVKVASWCLPLGP